MAAHAATLAGSALAGRVAAPAVASQKDAMRGSALRAHAPVAIRSNGRSVVTAAAQNSEEKTTLGAALRNTAFGLAAAAAVAMPMNAPPAEALLPVGDPVSNANALLRYALPIPNEKNPIRKMQKTLEDINQSLRVPSMRVKVDGTMKAATKSLKIVDKQSDKILADVASANKAEAAALLKEIREGLVKLQDLANKENIQEVPYLQQELLTKVGLVEADMIAQFPFEVPAEYASRPLLKGRATVEIGLSLKRELRTNKEVVTMVLDGLNAPVTAGNFVDLVNRGFYNGMEIQRSDGFVVQTGDPDGPAAGFIDPATGETRKVPLEIKIDGDKEPIYNFPLEEIGRYNEQPTLTFNAYGTIAMAREEFDPDSASSQVFWLLKENEITPSAANILDGRYSVFGYCTENQDIVGKLKVGDVIDYMKVTKGQEFMVNSK